MTEAEMLAEAESIACAEDWDSNNDKIRAIADLVRRYALEGDAPLYDALTEARYWLMGARVLPSGPARERMEAKIAGALAKARPNAAPAAPKSTP